MRALDASRKVPVTITGEASLAEAHDSWTASWSARSSSSTPTCATRCRFRSHAIRRLPLVATGELVGMLTADDLLIDFVADLGDVVRPITGQVVFGYPEPETAPVPR